MLDYAFAKDPCFEIVYAAEYAHDAVTTYRGNIGDHIHECDIRSLHGSDFPKADLMIGGPPCQPFSAANRHDSARGDKTVRMELQISMHSTSRNLCFQNLVPAHTDRVMGAFQKLHKKHE